MNHKIFLSCLFSLLPFFSLSQVWDQVSNFVGDGRHHPITFSNEEYGFVVSGSYLTDSYKYDKANDTWIQLQDFPSTGRGYAYGVTFGNKAYMGFGSTDFGSYPTDWWEYDMDNDTWLQKSDFPGDGRQHPAMVVVNNKIYVGCGGNSNGNLGDWWEYDILTDVWTQKTDIIGNNRHHPFYFGIGDYAYVGFGHGSFPGPGSNPSTSVYIYNDFYRYNPTNDSWTQLANFPSEARVAGTQFSYNGKGYILSGDGDDHGPLSSGEFWEYDPSIDTWSQLSSHPGGAIWAPGNFVVGCDVYFLLGQNWNSSIPTDPITVYKYKLSEDCGCTDSVAYNFSVLASSDDGSCCYISGCTDPLALNYDSLSCYDDGSCITPIIGCMDPSAVNFDPTANTTVASGGALDNLFGSGGYFNGNQHLIFDSYKECVIKSAMINSEASNTVTFELRDNTGTVLDDTTLLIVTGSQKIDLNFDVPIGSDMQLGVANNALQTNGLYRNNSNASYPYNIGGALEIISSSANTNPYDYYYFYYDIEVEISCQGLPNISWYCDGQGNCYDTTGGLGTYSTLVDCEIECSTVSVGESELMIEELLVYPNPSNGSFSVDLFVSEKTDITISVFNYTGKTIIKKDLEQFIGNHTQDINIGNHGRGIYLLQISHDDQIINKRLTIQ